MRRALSGVVFAACIAACSGFGSEDEEEKAPPPVVDNSKPPEQVDGKPIPGIYVSSSKGRDGATGFPGSPLRTLKEGMARAKAENLRLIVCAEEYAENIEVIDGVSAYGYYDCNVEPWGRVQRRAVVRAPKSPALVARGLTLATRYEGFDIIAPDLDATFAAGREGSSIAVDAREIKPNTFFLADSVLHGGKAAAGADAGPAPLPTPSGSSRGTDGIDQSSSACTPAMIACANMAVPGVKGPAPTCGATEPPAGPGGDGGDGMWFIERQPHDQANNVLLGRPLVATAQTAVGGLACGVTNAELRDPIDAGPPCGKGANGAAGAPGTNGANGSWSFDAEGFVLGDGTPGASGKPGQGGGGGGGSNSWAYPSGYTSPPLGGTGYFRSSRGGSGGAGGCGGLAGAVGGGGGASIGLLALDAELRLDRVIIESSNGGRAGSGGLGSLGGIGGAGGAPGYGAGVGGDGGRGGVGGSSGHGAPGPSIALAWRGKRPITDASTILQPGAGGEGRGPVSQAVAPLQTIPAVPAGPSIADHPIQ
ncbi:MAG: hypothetical protein JST00_02575 [Deltaproteobacteria bacterium]|nr:hypothetical protein [Deltaproteobacteria bacterium]